MKQNLIMRPLQQNDAAFLCSIFADNAEYYQIFHDSETCVAQWEARVSRFIRQKEVAHYILQDGERKVGWLSFSDLSPEARELDILVICREYLRCGYGSAALSQLLEKCREEAVASIVLNVNQSNGRAIRFYEKFGFEICGEEIVPECNDAIDLAQYKMKLNL